VFLLPINLPIKTILNWLYLTTIIILAIPSSLILVSWNALPGNFLYPIKRGLENTTLMLLGPSLNTKFSLRSRFLERRFNEATTLLAQSSVAGLFFLNEDLKSARADFLANKESTDPRQFSNEVNKLIYQLEVYNQELEQQKQSIAAAPPTFTNPSPMPYLPNLPITQQDYQNLLPNPNPAPAAAVPPLTPQQVIIINQVDQTQQNLNETIEALRQEQQRLQQELQRQSSQASPPSPSPSPASSPQLPIIPSPDAPELQLPQESPGIQANQEPEKSPEPKKESLPSEPPTQSPVESPVQSPV